jgi:hypothetical protein
MALVCPHKNKQASSSVSKLDEIVGHVAGQVQWLVWNSSQRPRSRAACQARSDDCSACGSATPRSTDAAQTASAAFAADHTAACVGSPWAAQHAALAADRADEQPRPARNMASQASWAASPAVRSTASWSGAASPAANRSHSSTAARLRGSESKCQMCRQQSAANLRRTWPSVSALSRSRSGVGSPESDSDTPTANLLRRRTPRSAVGPRGRGAVAQLTFIIVVRLLIIHREE